MTLFNNFLSSLIERLPLADVFSNWIQYDFLPFKLFFYFMIIGFSVFLVRRVLFE